MQFILKSIFCLHNHFGKLYKVLFRLRRIDTKNTTEKHSKFTVIESDI